ncbi:hypothetical protein [Streptomyces flavofungini]|uniref:hypothetical protein n=1 Tax=Streptomyces flavofungini TaxID=68200 RepID=UPI0025B1B2D9|nr:hypothetical protein [Streptomyces flavofungini]WJV44258.1 hypothetical protein QUY26_01100 [Streptomyces flavofungini]
MEVVLAAAIAVVGTLMGSVITYLLQVRTAEHGERRRNREQLRQERLTAFCAVVDALHSVRRAEHDRWRHEQESPEGAEAIEARERSIELRPAAWSALTRLHLLVDEPELVRSAQRAYRSVRAIHWAQDEDDLHDRDRASRAALDAFLSAAAVYMREAMTG